MDITWDVTDQKVRADLIEEMEANENLYRKEESFRRFEIYRDRQEKYVLQRLAGDTSIESVRDMRTFTSINLTRKMVHELASIYLREPTREYTDSNELQTETLDAHYRYSHANVKFKQGNRMFKLHDQSAMKVIPKNGFIGLDVLQPHHYDVVPNRIQPEKGEIYIISTFDRSRVANNNDYRNFRANQESRFFGSNFVNEKIADADDWKKDDKKIYFWWTPQYAFMTNNKGLILDKDTKLPLQSVNFNEYLNPIGELAFVDLAIEKDFEYWVRAGDTITEFNVDFGVILSDVVNINKNQGFAIPVISSVEAPQNLKIGPDRALWLKIDPKEEAATRPEFQFVTPNPDLSGALQMSEDLLKYFLVSRSINIRDMLQGTAQAGSGIERLLMMIEKFEASQDDIDLFRAKEQEVYERIVKWHNVLRGTDNGLNPRVEGPELNENSEVMVNFGGPEMVQSKLEHLNWIEKQLELGLMSDVEAIEELREVDEDKAKDILKKIKEVERMDMNEMSVLNRKIIEEVPIDELPSDEEK